MHSPGLGFSLSSITDAIAAAGRAVTGAAGAACGVVNSAYAQSAATAIANATGSTRLAQGAAVAQTLCTGPTVVAATQAAPAAPTAPAAPAASAVSAAPRVFPVGAYHVRKKNGKYDIYAPAGSVLGGDAITVFTDGLGDALAGTACLQGACGLGGDELIAVDEPSPGNTPPRPIYKNPTVLVGAGIVGGLAVVGGIAAIVRRRRR